MIILKLSQRFVYSEFKTNNEWRIETYGVHPLCKECINPCKLGIGKGLIRFWCADFRRED